MNHTIISAMVGLALLATTAAAQDTVAPQAVVESRGSSPSRIETTVSGNAPDEANNITNQSNNPLTPKNQFILQNFFMPSPQGDGGRSADQELLRLYLPFKLFGPVFTSPSKPNHFSQPAGMQDLGIRPSTI